MGEKIAQELYDDIYLSESYLVGLFWINPDLYHTYGEDKINHKSFGNRIWQYYFYLGKELLKSGKKLFDDITVEEYVDRTKKMQKSYIEYGEYLTIQEVMDEVRGKEENFDGYYDEVKKYNMIRSLYELIGKKVITNIGRYNYKKLSSEQIGKYWQDNLNNKLLLCDSKIEEHNLLEGLENFIEEIDKKPDIGLPFDNSKDLTNICNGWDYGHIYIFSSFSGKGKCIVGDSYIYTDKGMIQIQNIPKYYNVNMNNECNANIISYRINTGIKKSLSTSHFYNMGLSKTIKIKTTQGYEIEGTLEHPIVILNKSGNLEFKQLQNIKQDDIIAISLNNNLWGKNSLDYDISYLLGILIGDGCLAGENRKFKSYSMSYSKSDIFMANKINNILENKLNVNNIVKRCKPNSNSTDYFFGNKDLYYKFKNEYGLSMSISKDKVVPVSVLEGDKKTVKAFLQGLFDADGTIDPRNESFEWCTASKEISRQIHLLLLNFGIRSTLKMRHIKGYAQEYYRIFIKGQNLKKFREEIGFRYSRHKVERLENCIKKPVNSNIDLIYNQYNNLSILHNELKIKYYDQYYNSEYMYKIECLDGTKRGILNGVYNHRNCSSYQLKEIIEALDYKSDLNNYLYNLSSNFFFDKIEIIKESENVVWDFTVPETHNFVSNGFISHNTSFAMSKVIMSCVKHSERLLIIANEMSIHEYKKLLLITIMGNEMYEWLQSKGYNGFHRQNIDKGNFSEEDKTKLKEATSIIKKITNNKHDYIKFVPLDIYTISNVEKTIRYYANRGYKRLIIDTAKPTEGGKGERWIQFTEDFERIYKLARPNGGGLNLAVFTTVQLADAMVKQRFLDETCLGDAKKIKNVASVTWHMRSVWDDEFKDGKREIKVRQYRKSSNLPKGYETLEFTLEKSSNYTYMLLFTSKNRRGMSNDTGLDVLVFKVSFNRNSWQEIGWTKIYKDY
jgi:intein/homing endonuclease